ncbi:PRC-barrel domain containing protein [Streptomyces beigongshangae]|uniref:PRC-barrel domain containing protein n=1 Tax=Streptomyces beigongshangae TaxID=2841597 RepID=UPI0021A45A33|nr:PRC-barrel domain containing protein [Streptomyces sp. REN17]
MMGDHLTDRVPTAGHTPDDDLTGYRVEAEDGRVGKVSKYTNDLGPGFLVVRTGVRFLAKDVVIPSDTVTDIDHETRLLRLSGGKEQIRTARVFDPDTFLGDPRHRDQLGGSRGSGH